MNTAFLPRLTGIAALQAVLVVLEKEIVTMTMTALETWCVETTTVGILKGTSSSPTQIWTVVHPPDPDQPWPPVSVRPCSLSFIVLIRLNWF